MPLPPPGHPYWTLAYVDEGTDLATWLLLFGQGLKGLPKGANSEISADDPDGAKAWGMGEVRGFYGLHVSDWEPHDAEPGTTHTYWTATPIHTH
jgi:hypothetical protein